MELEENFGRQRFALSEWMDDNMIFGMHVGIAIVRLKLHIYVCASYSDGGNATIGKVFLHIYLQADFSPYQIRNYFYFVRCLLLSIVCLFGSSSSVCDVYKNRHNATLMMRGWQAGP